MISTIIITLNEEKRIRECLKSVKWTDEIIVIDAKSSDNTVSICKEYTDKVFIREWLGYSNQKNFGIEKAENDWILSIDADERITPELKDEIIEKVAVPIFDGYYFPRKSFFLGKWIKHSGWYPDCQLRLFKKDKGKFNKRDVHEGVELTSNNIGYLKNDLLHYPYGDLKHYFEKFNEYTTLSSNALDKRGNNVFFHSIVKKGRNFHWYNLIIDPILFFIKSYFLRLGFLDGIQGFIVCMISAFNTLVKYAKLWEIQKHKNEKI
jgi:glycosyltransferase involved in cell wall biosynthesis